MNKVPTKAELRRRLRSLRAALGVAQQAHAAAQLTSRVVTIARFRSSRRIACYLPNDGEIDPRPLIKRIWQMRKRCYLPVLSRLSHDRLWFAPVTRQTRFRPNRYGIPEPLTSARTWVRAQKLDLILMPLVGFDIRGNRLGMGGGFYDKSLAFLRDRRCWTRPKLIGLAYDFQKVDVLAPEPWDIPLQAIATDQAIYL